MTTLAPLTIVSAGAGSGKTYKLQTLLGEWVANRVIEPDRIVAVTFTEAAAAELRGRIRAELISIGRLEDALKLDAAFIATIHGFGLRLLTEYAFEAGYAPHSRLLDEDEQASFVRRALAEAEAADEIISDLTRYGYRYDFGSGNSPETGFRNRVLSVIDTLRLIGRLELDAELTPHAASYIDNTYGPITTAAALDKQLSDAVTTLLTAFPENLAQTATNDTARREFDAGYRALRDAQEVGRLSRDFALWVRLSKLRMSKRGSPTPDGYDELAKKVIEAASHLEQHPGPRDRERIHAKVLMEAAFESLERYREAKQKFGLVDYVDMLSEAYSLLARDDVLADFKSRVDCLVIDEFQDTNPIQFALLWSLQRAGIPTVVVGDLKQAIMGFQGADPRLMQALADNNGESVEKLDANWRTQPALMPFINAVGVGLFGTQYTELTPRAEAGYQKPLEVIECPKRPPRVLGQRAVEVRAAYTVERLSDLLNDPTQFVRDRHTGKKRRLRGGDIAILCPTNKMLAQYAGILRAAGVRCRLAGKGWLSSPVVQLVWHALEYAANPDDQHAALYLAVTELGTHTLENALERLIDGQQLEDLVLDRLATLGSGVSNMTTEKITAQVIDALNIYGNIAAWPDAAQARADLLRFESEAQQFVAAKPEGLASVGIHGSGIKTFLAWLAHRSEGKEFDMRQSARVVDNDAVELVTWHRSKGREWPIVAVCGWEASIRVYLPDLSVIYENFNDLGSLLGGARVTYSPAFEAAETQEKFKAPLLEEAREEARRLIYVAMTRPREKLILEWPSHRDGKDGETFYSEFRDVTGIKLSDKGLSVGGMDFVARRSIAANAFPDNFDPDGLNVEDPVPEFGRRALCYGKTMLNPASMQPDSRSPSLHGDWEASYTIKDDDIETTSYASGVKIDVAMEATELGTDLHTCFEIGHAVSRERLRPLISQLIDEATIDHVLENVAAFNDWLSSSFPGCHVIREAPILYIDDAGSVVSGFIDLVVETAEGLLIIDHKSDRVTDIKSGFRSYVSQLEDYSSGLQKAHPNKPVLGIAVNWIRLGTISSFAANRKFALPF
jgi:ATP-dependent helicase/nuclease subunit A